MTEPASPQVLLVVELTARPGAQREMREAVDRLVDATRQENGVVRFEVGLDPDDDTRVLGYEIWASQDALDAHAAKAHTREFKARVRDLVVDPAAPMHVRRWRPMREERPAAYMPGTPGFAAAPAPGFTSERRLVNDVRLHYVIGGSGTPVVLLHGFPSTWYAWRDVMPKLAGRHTVIALDLRGLGGSDPGTQPNDVPTGADDLHGLVAGLGLGPVLLAGQDWGGSTAFAFAAAHPEQVRRLAVLEAMPAGPWTETGSDRGGTWFAGFHQVPDLPERMVAGREIGKQGNGDGGETGGHENGAGGPLQFVDRVAQRVRRRRSARAVGVFLPMRLHGPRIGKEHGRSVHHRRIDKTALTERVVSRPDQSRLRTVLRGNLCLVAHETSSSG